MLIRLWRPERESECLWLYCCISMPKTDTVQPSIDRRNVCVCVCVTARVCLCICVMLYSYNSEPNTLLFTIHCDVLFVSFFRFVAIVDMENIGSFVVTPPAHTHTLAEERHSHVVVCWRNISELVRKRDESMCANRFMRMCAWYTLTVCVCVWHWHVKFWYIFACFCLTQSHHNWWWILHTDTDTHRNIYISMNSRSHKPFSARDQGETRWTRTREDFK